MISSTCTEMGVTPFSSVLRCQYPIWAN